MKTRFCIFSLFLLALASCHSPFGARSNASSDTVVSPEPQSPQRSQLLAIDSLAWQQPDSALALLLPWLDTVDSSQAFDNHYAQLLLAELLYKNDYAQTNRDELLQAVDYFDSVTATTGWADTHGVSLHDVFLAARAHYINGVGYYEHDSAVNASQEYLKALEIMEEQFGEKMLVGKKARFMTYIFNRLGHMFSEHFMMESAILCYKNSCKFSVISPISPYSISNAMYRIGKQFNMKGDIDSAYYYYSQAITNMPDTANLFYRNVISSQALLGYQLTQQAVPSIQRLKQMVFLAEDYDERLTRYLVIGHIFYMERLYDSAQYYLMTVFENKNDIVSQMQAADYLHVICDTLGDSEKSEMFLRFLAQQKKTEGQNKALVSQLNDLFQKHLNKKHEKLAEKERKKAVKKAVNTIIPIAIFVAMFIIVLAKIRGKNLLKKQQAEADKILEETGKQMEAERQSHKMQQAALSGRLKRSNRELSNVLKQLEQTSAKTALDEPEIRDDYSAYVNAPVCLDIVRLVHTQQFKSKMDYHVYKENALSKEQILALRHAAEKHLPQFKSQIRKQFPNLTDSDMDYCYLFLLGLNEADISALMQRAYTTVCDRSRKISRIIGANDSLYQSLCNMLSKQ